MAQEDRPYRGTFSRTSRRQLRAAIARLKQIHGTAQFDTLKQAQTWIHSAAREALVAEVKPYLVKDESVDVQTGLEFWFRPPTGKGFPSRLKQSAVTLLVLYPLTLIIPRLWGLGSQIAPPLGDVFVLNLVVDATIVGLLTYVFMPRATRLFSKWLYA